MLNIINAFVEIYGKMISTRWCRVRAMYVEGGYCEKGMGEKERLSSEVVPEWSEEWKKSDMETKIEGDR